MRRVRVLIADDSSFLREVLREVLEEDRDIQVVAEAADGREAVRLVGLHAPDLVTMDVRMPGLDGLAAVDEIMSSRPTPILMLTALGAGPDSTLAFEALRRGALGVWSKARVGEGGEGGARLREEVRRLAEVRVVRHARLGGPVTPLPRPADAPRYQPPPPPPRVEPPPPRPLGARRVRVVGVGASAGGPPAVAAVLGALPRDYPACVAVVQHIPPGFASSFEGFLRTCTPLKVAVVREPVRAEPGTVLLPADDRHLVAVGPDGFAPSDAPPERGHRPSVDALFLSLAQVFGADAVGALLTGMGDDGARGLLAMRGRGALTLAQDEATSVVFGMPRAARDLGAVERLLPLDQLIATLKREGPCPPSSG